MHACTSSKLTKINLFLFHHVIYYLFTIQTDRSENTAKHHLVFGYTKSTSELITLIHCTIGKTLAIVDNIRKPRSGDDVKNARLIKAFGALLISHRRFFKHPKHMFNLIDKKIIAILHPVIFTYLTLYNVR